MYKNPGFAAAGTGDNQHRFRCSSHSLTLCVIQGVQDRSDIHQRVGRVRKARHLNKHGALSVHIKPAEGGQNSIVGKADSAVAQCRGL
jgi:hypothetical protein